MWLKKVEGLAPTQDCTTIPATAPATVYFGAVEVRKWKIAGQEQILTYPHPAVKLLNDLTPAAATYLHRDGLSSVRAITSAAGAKIEAALYKPFGEQSEWVLPGNAAPETKGWIGERYDADAGLQYLNARYYDPELSLFLQPDWFEVTKAGVGTNRFSYSFNDPVNGLDPGGNQTKKEKDDDDKSKAEESVRKVDIEPKGTGLSIGVLVDFSGVVGADALGLGKEVMVYFDRNPDVGFETVKFSTANKDQFYVAIASEGFHPELNDPKAFKDFITSALEGEAYSVIGSGNRNDRLTFSVDAAFNQSVGFADTLGGTVVAYDDIKQVADKVIGNPDGLSVAAKTNLATFSFSQLSTGGILFDTAKVRPILEPALK
jgi:RHS repeat-associated protein